MKKLLLILPVVALAACGHDANEYISGCEKVLDTSMGDVYKCPMTEDLATIKSMEADCMFIGTQMGDKIDVITLASDTEYAYVNVYGDKCETEGQVSYRVIVNTPKITDENKTFYAVEVCR